MKKVSETRAAKNVNVRETAQYITDMLLEMRNIAKQSKFETLLSLLELSYCEAFSIANKAEVPEGEIERIRALSQASGG